MLFDSTRLCEKYHPKYPKLVCYTKSPRQKRVEGVVSPLQAEIMAILFGLQVVCEMDYKELLEESDCWIAIQKISKRRDSLREWGCFIMDILDRSLDFNHCFFKHICRSANGLTHNLTKFYCEVGEHRIWRNYLPLSICNPDLY